MALKLKNNAVSRLASSITAASTSLSLTPGDGALFPALSAGDYFPATIVRASDNAIEIVKVTARATDVLTVTRAQEGTTALAFSAGDRIELRMTAQTFLDQATYTINTVLSSPAFTGTPTAPTPDVSSNDTRIATTAFALALLRSFGVGNTATVAWTSPDDWTKATGTYIVTAANFPTPPFPGVATDCVVMHSRSTSTANQIAFIAASAVGVVRVATRRWGGGSGGAWSAWTELATNDTALLKSGGTMTGALTLPGAPTNNLHAATKQYVDERATPFSSAAENAAGTIENKAVDPLGIREAFNAGGSAPVYACRAWVNFNGSATASIKSSGNVSSVTDNGGGDYTVNFSTAMPDANYAFVPGTSGQRAVTITLHVSADAAAPTYKAAAGLRIWCGGSSTYTRQADMSIAIFR